MPLLPSLPEDALVKDVYSMNPKLFRAWVEVEEIVMRGPSRFSPGERELMAAYVSALNSCNYCYGSHLEAACAFGVDATVLEKLVENFESAPMTPKLRPVFAFLEKLTLHPSRIIQADAEAVFSAGWDEKSLQDAILVCCCFSFMNRLADGHGLPADSSKFVERGRRHADKGYLAQYASETISRD
jgi:uncharacterized peroxidase-related enzyme